jgi:hypothetical protein
LDSLLESLPFRGDLENIFAEKFGAFLLKILIVNAKNYHNIGLQEKTPFFEMNLAIFKRM